jgi:hypothetical protein
LEGGQGIEESSQGASEKIFKHSSGCGNHRLTDKGLTTEPGNRVGSEAFGICCYFAGKVY